MMIRETFIKAAVAFIFFFAGLSAGYLMRGRKKIQTKTPELIIVLDSMKSEIGKKDLILDSLLSEISNQLKNISDVDEDVRMDILSVDTMSRDAKEKFFADRYGL